MKRAIALSVFLFVGCTLPMIDVQKAQAKGVSTVEEYDPTETGFHFPRFLSGKTFYEIDESGNRSGASFGFKAALYLPLAETLKCFEGTNRVDVSRFLPGIERVGDTEYFLHLELDPLSNRFHYGGDVIVEVLIDGNAITINGHKVKAIK